MNLMDIVNRAAKLQNDAERVAFLDQAFAGQPELRKELEQLLAYLIQVKLTNNDKAVAQQPPTLPEGSVTADYVPKVNIGSVIAGKYKIREQLGEGGMGTVYIVDTVRDVKTSFALKLIKSDYASHQVIARFEQERQALALMNHPNIAKFIDAGTSESKQPYFVMEHIKGLPITKFCDQEKLTVEERLRLFQSVCHAVQHAHHKGIIHRDLKPGNILVTYIDGVPVPKVIDFGVAKATLQPLTDKTIHSEINSIIGTLEYMAPEQAEVNSLDIDTRADIYALGVILYELLTGAVPFSRKELGAAAMLRMLEMIRLEEPAKPSTKLSHSGSLPSVAATRKIDPAMLMKKLRGEIDWIIMKCLEKERGRRYQGPNQLANDIDNYLHDLPLVASPPSKTYRLKKFLRRHRGKVLAASVLVLSLVGGIVGTSWGMMKAVKAEHAAELEAATARNESAIHRSLVEYMERDLLIQVDPEEQARLGLPIDKDLPLRVILDRASGGLSQRFENSPQIEAALRFTIGKSYLSIGLKEQAKENLEKAYQLRKVELGNSALATLDVAEKLGELNHLMNKNEEALRFFKFVLEAHKNLPDQSIETTLRVRYNIASVQRTMNQLEEAQSSLSKLVVDQRRELGETHVQTIKSMRAQADVMRLMHNVDQAEALLEKTLQLSKQGLMANHPITLGVMNNLAQIYRARGKLERSLQLYDELLTCAGIVYDQQSPFILLYKNNKSVCLIMLERYNEAESLLYEIMPIYERLLGPDHINALSVKANYASVLQKKGDIVGAIQIHKEILPRLKKHLGTNSGTPLFAMEDLARAYIKNNEIKLGLNLLEEIMKFHESQSRFDERAYLRILHLHADTNVSIGKLDEAVTLLRKSLVIAGIGPEGRSGINKKIEHILIDSAK